MSLTADQVAIIKSTVPVLAAHGNTITTTFYRNILSENPILNNIFSITNQESGEQPRALAGALFAYASYIDDLGVLSPAIERIVQKHVSLSIQPAQYDVVGAYLLAAMGEVLGAALTPEVLAAWTAAYGQLAAVLIGKEAAIYESQKDWPSWRKFKVVRKEPESNNITSFYLSPVDEQPLPPFKPGQYISVQIPIPELGYLQSRQYSLSDAPRADYYRISVKKEAGVAIEGKDALTRAGLVSNNLHSNIQVGDEVEVSHPAGDFFLIPSTAPIVLISAGVGVTPMISMLNHTTQTGHTAPISWIHTARNSAEHAFSKHVRDKANAHEHVHEVVFKSVTGDEDVEGIHFHHKGRMHLSRVDADKDLFLKNAETRYYICGPLLFMRQMAEYLKSVGIAADHIHMELFGTGGC